MRFWKVIAVLAGILLIAGGLYCLFTPIETYLTIGYVIGIGMVVDAVARIVAWFEARKTVFVDGWLLVGGILSGVFGVLLIGNTALQFFADVAIAYMFAIWLIVLAMITIFRAFEIRRFHVEANTLIIGRRWWVRLIFGLLMGIFAVLSLMNPTIIMTTVGIFIALGIMTTGANIVTAALDT